MSTTPLWVLDYEGPTWREQGDEWTQFAGQPRAREASAVELVAALIAEGGEIVTRCTTHGFQYCHNSSIDLRECNEVEVLVFPIPVESAEAKET